METIIQKLGEWSNNSLYIKREDFFPFSFGGNKARKGMLFWQDLQLKNADVVVTYGSTSSNHCRVIANIAALLKIPCYIISPKEIAHKTFNQCMMEWFNATLLFCDIKDVHDTIETTLDRLRKDGHNPYFIQGGGHGNLGTEAYVNCYDEIKKYEKDQNIHFDYIFHASGTGTTQAGLICGQLIHNDDRKIIGISIARKNPRGRQVVLDSCSEYLRENNISCSIQELEEKTIFIDRYTGEGYGKDNHNITDIIKNTMIQYGIPMDSTYTGKAFWGMKQYILENSLCDKKILFIHTGGTPLFFDNLLTGISSNSKD